VKRLLGRLSVVDLLLSLLRLGSPRLQRLAVRLCRSVFQLPALLPGSATSTAEQLSLPSIVSTLYGILGGMLYTSGGDPSASRTSRGSGYELTEITGQYALMLHAPPGMSANDIMKQLSKANLPKLRVKDVARMLSLRLTTICCLSFVFPLMMFS
jgi:hypothetical protein